MAEKNNSAQNEEILKTYFELNPEIKKQFDAMSPGEKSAFREKFFKDLKTERVKELHRGRNSDEWQQAIDELNVRVLQAMNKAPANLAKMPPKKRRETIEQTLNSFTPEENAKFIAVSNQAKKELLENFPPKKLLSIAGKLEELVAQTQNAATKQALSSQLNMVNEEILQTVQEMAKGTNKEKPEGIIIDQTNIADVYEGATMMLDYAEKKFFNNKPTAETTAVRQHLESQINIYDEMHGLSGLTSADKERVEANYQKASKIAHKLPLDKEIQTALSNLEFMDEKGQPVKDQQAQQKLIYETIREEAARNLAGIKGDITEQMVKDEMSRKSVQCIGSLVMGSEFAMAQNPNQAMNAITDLLNGKKYQVSAPGIIGYSAEYTNKSMGYIDRLSHKIGNTAPVLGQMYRKVQKFDKSCIDRFGPAYVKAKTLLQTIRGNCKRAVPMAALGMALTHVQPLGASIMTGVCVGYAAIRLAKSYKQMKKEAKEKGKKFGAKDFFKKHGMDIAITAISATGTALGMPMLGAAAMGINALRSGVKTFKEKSKEGNKFWSAFGKAAAAASATAVTTYATAAITSSVLQATGFGSWLDNQFGHGQEEGRRWVQDEPPHKSFDYSDKDIQAAEKFNETPSRHFEYVGKGHTIADYNNPDNYENRAWYSEEQHAAATKSIQEGMSKLGWDEGSEEVMLKKLASFTREYANPDHPLNDGSGRTVGEAFTYKDGNYSVNPQQLLDKVLSGETMNATDSRLLHNLQFASSPQGHALVDVGIKPEELYSYDTGKPHGVMINESGDSGHWEEGQPLEPGIFVPAIPYDEQYQGQLMKLNERVGARGHFWTTLTKITMPPVNQTSAPGQTPKPPVNQTPAPGQTPKPPVNQTPAPGQTPKPPVNQTPAPGQTPKPPVNQTPAPGQTPQPPVNQTPAPGQTPAPSKPILNNKGIGEPVIDGVNPEDSADALPIEFGPHYEEKKAPTPVKGLDQNIIKRVYIRGQ